MWKMTVSICYLFLTLTALGQQAKPVTITGRIVDSNAQPVAGAEVAVYKQLYDYVTREDYAKLLDEETGRFRDIASFGDVLSKGRVLGD